MKSWVLANQVNTVAFTGNLLQVVREWLLWKWFLPSQPMRIRRSERGDPPAEAFDVDGSVW